MSRAGLMRWEIEAGDRARQVVLTRPDEAFTVVIDGRSWHVNVARIDGRTLSLLVEDPASHIGRTASYEVTLVADAAAGQLTAWVGALPITVAVNGRRRWGRKDEGADSLQAGAGPQRITAPMPGKIVRVLVSSGDLVRPRQPLIVIEAMKMENELRAGREGTISELHAREGSLVDAGALLAVISA